MNIERVNEVWKPAVGYEGVYSVSDLGRVRRDISSKKTHCGKILATDRTKDGYLIATLCLKSSPRRRSVASLVAAAFIGPRPTGNHVNHRNGIRDDNSLKNLEYVTPGGNVRHAIDVLGKPWGAKPGAGHHNAKLSEADVYMIRFVFSRGLPPDGIALQFGVKKGTVLDVAARRTWRNI